MQELLVPLAEAAPVVGDIGRRNRWPAVTWMMGEVGRPSSRNIMSGRFEPIMHTLLKDCAGRRRSDINGLWVCASNEWSSTEERCCAEQSKGCEFPDQWLLQDLVQWPARKNPDGEKSCRRILPGCYTKWLRRCGFRSIKLSRSTPGIDRPDGDEGIAAHDMIEVIQIDRGIAMGSSEDDSLADVWERFIV